MSLSDVKLAFQVRNNALHVKVGKRDTLEMQLANCQERLRTIDMESENLSKASAFLQTLSDQTRQQILDKISGIVTDALQKIKDKNLTFRMDLSTSGNQVDLDFIVHDRLLNMDQDILQSAGGTIADIVTFPLRVSLLLKWDPELARVLIMDENLKFVSVADQAPLSDFVRQLTEQLKLQVILVTHSETISSRAHRVFQVSKKDGASSVVES
jgi:DNA repair ATPase RecN